MGVEVVCGCVFFWVQSHMSVPAPVPELVTSTAGWDEPNHPTACDPCLFFLRPHVTMDGDRHRQGVGGTMS